MTGKQISAMLSSKRGDWRTPKAFFDALDQEFHFTLDAAASPENALCDTYFTENEDGLQQSWQGHTVWLNPPYNKGQIPLWLDKATREFNKGGCTIVMLLPARVNSKWFHQYIYHRHEIRFPFGRLRFDGNANPAAFDSMVVVFRRY